MQTQNKSTTGVLIKTKRKNSFETSKYLNLPDLQFYHWCKQQYRVNRGVYNTIDQWFYDYGIINIHYRRIQLLAFLEFVEGESLVQDNQKFIRFGHGGLSSRLSEFVNNKGQWSNVIPLK